MTTFKENIPEGPQVAQVIDSLVRDGNKIIFATSFGFQPAMVAAAKKYPSVYFEMATGTAQAKNMAEYFGAGEDAIYLSGMAAGAATTKGVIGYVVPFAIPEVIRHANAFALGAQRTHPGVQVKLVWTNSWFDPAKEKKAAESLVAAGADVLGQNVDSPAAGQYAESKKIPWVGYDSDASKFAPTSWLTAAVYNWGVYYIPRVKAAMNGTWKTGFYYGGSEGEVRRYRQVRAGRVGRDQGGDREEEGRPDRGLVLRVRGPVVRPEGEVAGEAGPAAEREGSVRGQLAGQGDHREREGLASGLAAG